VVCAEETIPTGTDGDGEYLAHANVVLAINHQPGLGMFSSVQTGFRKVKEVHDHPVSTLLLLVDHPLVSESTVHALWDAHALAPHAFIVPTYRGQAGHPIVVPAQAMSLILDSPCSSRLDGLMAKHDRIMVDVPDAGVVTTSIRPRRTARFLASKLLSSATEQVWGSGAKPSVEPGDVRSCWTNLLFSDSRHQAVDRLEGKETG